MTWQPIETAPKDGTVFLAYGPVGNEDAEQEYFISCWRSDYGDWEEEYKIIGWWYHDCDMNGHRGYPSVWMPLPDPPKE